MQEKYYLFWYFFSKKCEKRAPGNHPDARHLTKKTNLTKRRTYSPVFPYTFAVALYKLTTVTTAFNK